MPGGSEWIFQGEPAGRTLEYPFTATWHGMDIHMILGEAWNVIPSKCQKFVPTAIVVVEIGVVVVSSSILY